MADSTAAYSRLARFVLTHRKAVLVVSLLLGLASALIGLPPDVDANILALLPKSEPTAVALRRLNDEEGGANLVTMAFESDDAEALDAAMDSLVDELEKNETIEFAIHEIDEDLAFRVGLMSLTPSELDELNIRLRAALALGPALNPIVAQRLMDMGPLTQRIANSGKANPLAGEDGQARVLVRPTGSSFDPVFSERLIQDVEAVLAAADLESKGIEHIYTGGAYYNVVADMRGIRSDIVNTSIVSAVLVLLILMIAFRSARTVLAVLPPLALANLINLAITEIGIGSVNTYTSFGTAVLIGLGIAFAVHLIGRYREERIQNKLSTEAAIERAWLVTGPPCMTAALTSAAGFLALSVGQFRGFYQLGTVLAVGLMLSLVAMLVLLPVLLYYLDPDPKYTLLGARTDIPRSTTSTYAWAPAGIMLATIATIVVGVANLPEADDFEYDLSALRREGQAFSEMSEDEKAFAKASYAPIVVSYDDADSLEKDHKKLKAMIERGDLPHVAGVVSIVNILPDDQEARIAALAQTAELMENKNVRYLPPPVVKSLIRLRGFDPRPLTKDDLPEKLRALIGAQEGRHRILLMPTGNMWDLRESESLLAELEGVVPNPAGGFLAQGALYRTVKHDMPRIALVAFVLVTLLSAMDLRKTTRTVTAVSVLLAGMLWATVTIQWMGVKLSMINIVGVPILLGIGVDVVIHLLHRIEEEGPGGVRRAMQTAGVAAFIGTITTLASFLSLTQAGHRGVRSLGILVVIGLAAVFLATVVLLPLAWSAGWKLSGMAPGDTIHDE